MFYNYFDVGSMYMNSSSGRFITKSEEITKRFLYDGNSKFDNTTKHINFGIHMNVYLFHAYLYV